jgi:hypothetical protein
MAHKHRPYTAEDLESALEEGNVTLERLAATVVGLMPGKVKASAPAQNSGPAKPEPVHGAKR